MFKLGLALAVALNTAVTMLFGAQPALAQPSAPPALSSPSPIYNELGLAQLDATDALMSIRTALLDAGESQIVVDNACISWLASIYGEPWTAEELYQVYNAQINMLGTLEAGWIQPAEVTWALRQVTIQAMNDASAKGMWRYRYATSREATGEYDDGSWIWGLDSQ